MADIETRTITLDGVTLAPMPVRDAQEVQRAFKKLEDAAKKERERAEAAEEEKEEMSEKCDAAIATIDEVKAEAKTEIEKRDAVIATKDAEIETLKQQLKDAAITPEKLDAFVQERGTVIDRARHALGDAKADFKTKSVGEIRRQVVDARLGQKAKDWTDAQVEASFDSLTAGFESSKTSGNVADAAAAFSRPSFAYTADAAQKAKDAMYDEYNDNLAKAWQQTRQ